MTRAGRRRWLWRTLTVLFLAVIGVLLWYQFRQLDWPEISAALRGYSAAQLAPALLFALAGHLVYACFDLLGRAHTQHGLPVRVVLPRVLVCYAFNLNLSAMLGGMALRYRLYTRCGLRVDTITQVIALSITANWLGYTLLLGMLFIAGLPTLPGDWPLAGSVQRLLGLGLLCVPVLAVLATLRWQGRRWHFRQHRFTLPGPRLCGAQLLLGSANWMLMAAVLYTLLPSDHNYPTVLAVLLTSSLAGLVSRVPAGLGVLEATALVLLRGESDQVTLMAALIGFRVCYFLLPLAGAAVLYPWLELAHRHRQAGTHSNHSPHSSHSTHSQKRHQAPLS